MRTYELTVICPTKTVDDAKTALKEILAKHKISIVKEDDWGLRRLAYEIDGQTEGYYLHLNVQADTQVIKPAETDFHLSGKYLRYMFVVTEAKTA